MKNSPERIFKGIIDTLRADVLPHVTEAYARGQTLAAIDLLGNLAPMLEPARAPLMARLTARRDCINTICNLMPDLSPAKPPLGPHQLAGLPSSAALLAEAERLDEILSQMAGQLFGPATAPTDARRQAQHCFRRFIREQASYEMSLIQKPLFAEIAKGKAEDQSNEDGEDK